MDLKLPDSTLRKYLATKATPEKIAEVLTLCGPSVDRLHRLKNDYVYDIEAITNRVDTVSAFGIAREAAAILPLFGIAAKLVHDPYHISSSDLPQRQSAKLPLTVEIEDKTLVTHFAAIVLDHITVTKSPDEIIDQLALSGVRSLNNLIDVTNYLTLCFGQPVHIFDYEKIHGHLLKLRQSKENEKIVTLDGRTHLLEGGDIVIEDGDGRLIDLCGIMGGKLSEVDETTTKAVLFVQTYQPKKIRRTSLYTQERTLAAQIFEKQPDTRLVIPTLIEGVNLLIKYSKAHIAGDSIEYFFEKPEPKTVKLDLKWLNQLIGYKFDLKTVTSILTRLGFKIKKLTAGSLEAAVPSWRLYDISIQADLAEEIARIFGYFRLDSKLPITAGLSVSTDAVLNWEYLTKKYLADLGFTEIFNYSLVSRQLFTRANISPDHSVALTNPLTTDYALMRRSLIPSLLQDLETNQGKIDLPLRLFELSNIYLFDEHQPDRLPEERPILGLATQGIDYRQAKGYLEATLKSLHLENLNYIQSSEKSGPWQSNRTAEVYSGQHFLGIFGSINSTVKEAFHLRDDVFIANLDFQTAARLANTDYLYSPISEYPDVIEDVTIKSDLHLSEIIQLIKQQSSLITGVIYKESLTNKHTFTIRFNDPGKNLTQEDIEQIKTKILKIN